MQSTVFISETIDDLVQRIDKVKVCQEHLKLVATGLTRLRRGLNETTVIRDGSRLQQDVAQILQAIDEIVTSCSENENDLNGITYRDLESALFWLLTRLAHLEADMAGDCEAKVNILSNAYQIQHLLAQKVFDETIRQRLETIEERTRENTKENLRLLREKYFHTIRDYLLYCAEVHKSVPLSGLTSDTVAKVAHTFYKITSEEQIRLEHNWQACELPLTRTFVQFKADKSTSFERNESRRLLMGLKVNLTQDPCSIRETSENIWQRLVSTPYMMSLMERDRYSTEEDDVSEENIIRTKRWIVILGDPGSGKTSFARWLVRHLAQTLLLNGQHSTDYGPLRIPILIRIGEFAEMLNEQPSLTLFDYIGKHKWMGQTNFDNIPVSLDYLSCALQDYIEQGQALIILDGLDEIPLSNQRSKIINIVENFVDTYVQTPTCSSAFDNPHLNRLFDNPSQSGGNQLIVTSRIVGYHAAPLAGQFAHYTIRPMNIEHMKDFVDYWFFRVHQHILDILSLSLTNQGESHGEALKKELEKIENVGLLDVASNSCLMSFICSVAFSQLEGSPLPMQRIQLYEQIVNSMLSLWSSKRSTIPIPDLIRILSEIATYIHENSASGLIHEEKMKEVCIQSIKTSLNKNAHTEEQIPDIESQASEFVRIIREDVGILAARGESLYGFLHLTFQEYFTCLKLIDVDQVKLNVHKSCQENKAQIIAHSLSCHMNDPRFRVPIALALGKISSSSSQKDFDEFCLAFIQDQDKSDSLLPLGAYMLINCSNDLVNYPSADVLFYALDCLIVAAGQHRWSLVCPFLIGQISNALKKLRSNVVSLWINNFLSRSPPYEIQTISALCHLIEGKPHDFENIKWLDQSSCSMLQSFASLNNENHEFAINRLLVKVAFSNYRLLPVDPTTFKGFLIGEEIELSTIPIALFPLIITLYGGLKRNGQAVVFDPFHIYRESTSVTPLLIRFLSERSRGKQNQDIMFIKQECLKLLITQMKNHDESCETVDLCIATICLCGIDYLRENDKLIISNSLFRTSMNRLKYISMLLRQFYFTGDENDRSIENEATKFISSVTERFVFSESSKRQFLDLLNSLRSGVARLRSSTTSILLEGRSKPYSRVTLHLPNVLQKEYEFLNNLLLADAQFYLGRKSCSLLHHFTKIFWVLEQNHQFATQHRMAIAVDTIPQYLLFRNDEDLSFLLTFVPSHLQDLYLRLLEQGLIMINSKDFPSDNRQHLYFGYILLECLMKLSNESCKSMILLAALIALLPMLRMHQLENVASSLLWTISPKYSNFIRVFEITRQRPINYETGMYTNKVKTIPYAKHMTDEERRILYEECIKQEHQRLENALINNDGESMKLYSACVSLARIIRWATDQSKLSLLEKSVQGAMLIDNKLTRLDALCTIGLFSHSYYEQIQVDKRRCLQKEIEYQLDGIYPDLPLLLHTVIFIRCLPLLQCKQTIDKCLQNLLSKYNDALPRDQLVVYNALSPYLQFNFAFCSVVKHMSHSLRDHNKKVDNRSCILEEYFNIDTNESSSSSFFISNLRLVELVGQAHKVVQADDLRSLVLHTNVYNINESTATTLLQFDNPILTLEQAVVITNALSSAFASNHFDHVKKLCTVLSKSLHRVNSVEFKACRLLESWMKWKDSNELSSFAYHAAFLLANSDLWTVEVAIIICDLLSCENDRFRQRAEMILRSNIDDNDIRTSSKLGIDVLLILAAKKAHCQHTSPSANLTIGRIFFNTTQDNRSHLESFLWLERYRIHALLNKEYSLDKAVSLPIAHVVSYFPVGAAIDISFCDNIRRLSNDLMQYMWDLMASDFSLFLELDGDITSNAVVESHTQFVVSVLVFSVAPIKYTDETRRLMIDALITLMERSERDEVCRAAAYALGYICDEKTYRILFNKLQTIVNKQAGENMNDSDYFLCSLISSYCHCMSFQQIDFDQDAIDLLRQLLKHSSPNIFNAVRTGLGRLLKNSSLLFEMLGSDYIQCYHALIGSTAYVFLNDMSRNGLNITAEFIEQHPDLLSIFVVELYNSIRHFTKDVLYDITMDFFFSYGYPQYVEVASLLAVRIPAAFCAYINDWQDGDNLKRALFFTSKQHDFPRRAACLTILSVFGELTVELCEMFIEALRDDPHLQNTCYKCLTRINSIKDEAAVLNLLFSYLQSKSMNVRYTAAKLLLRLSQSSLIPFDQVQQVRTALNDLMFDSSSSEDLWLIEEQDEVMADCRYYYAGPLKDVIYSLLVQHLTGDASGTIRRNELNDIDSDFMESEKASRLASCLYEKKTEVNLEIERPSQIKSVD